MSVDYARVIDTRLENSEDITYVVQEGAQNINVIPIISSSNTTTSTTWNSNNTAPNVMRDSRMIVQGQVTFTLSVTNSDGVNAHDFWTGSNLGTKQYPWNRCTTIQHQLNNASYTYQNYLYLNDVARVKVCPKELNFYNSTQPDFIDTYSAASLSEISPLTSYTSTIGGDGVYKPRSLGINVTNNSIAAGATEDVTVTYDIYEPLISPFTTISKRQGRAAVGVTSEIITATYVPDIWNNMMAWYDASGGNLTINSVSVSFGSSMSLIVNYLIPTKEYTKRIPRMSIQPFNQFFLTPTPLNNGVGINAGASITTSSLVANFQNVPDLILVYAKPQAGNTTVNTPDKYLLIEGMQAQFNNGPTCFSNLGPDQFYDLSVKNGLSMPREVFKQSQLNSNLTGATAVYGCGSVVCIRPSYDLQLQEGLTVGSMGKHVFQLTNITLTNNTATNFPACNLYIVGVMLAQLKRDGITYTQELVSVPNNVLEFAKNLSPMAHDEYMDQLDSNLFLSGGSFKSFFKKLWKGVKKGANYAVKGLDYGVRHADDIAKIVNTGMKLAPLVGLGDEEEEGEGMKPRKRMSKQQRSKAIDLFYE